ncbi:MAG TPA: cytochrome P460 family protein [Steroidobacteraceae bacterium]|nr:cytochrome P460 family protein [Steroidobacteraceae bacterium]
MKLPLVVLTLTAAAAVAAATPADVPYPANYRDWTHVKSMVIEPGHALHATFGGIHHLYANDPALQGYRSGKFPDGAVIVFDLLEAVAKDHAVTEGARKVVGVMHRDAKKFAATGGWGFEGFAGDSQTQRAVGASAATACFACHQAKRAQDYVFSSYRP